MLQKENIRRKKKCIVAGVEISWEMGMRSVVIADAQLHKWKRKMMTETL